MMLWLLQHPNVEQSLLSPREVDQLVNHDFGDYYSEYAASHFAAQVWVNNAWVTALCPGARRARPAGRLPAVLEPGEPRDHRLDHDPPRPRGSLLGLILPHGMLELTAVFVAGGVGLRLFWSWVEPGALTRTQSLAHEGRTAGTVAPRAGRRALRQRLHRGVRDASPLPTWARVGIGVLAEATFLAYVFVLGRQAHHRGRTGDIDDALLEDRVATQV